MEAAQNQKEASDSRVEEHLTQHFYNKSLDDGGELSYEERLQRNLKFMQENQVEHRI